MSLGRHGSRLAERHATLRQYFLFLNGCFQRLICSRLYFLRCAAMKARGSANNTMGPALIQLDCHSKHAELFEQPTRPNPSPLLILSVKHIYYYLTLFALYALSV